MFHALEIIVGLAFAGVGTGGAIAAIYTGKVPFLGNKQTASIQRAQEELRIMTLREQTAEHRLQAERHELNRQIMQAEGTIRLENLHDESFQKELTRGDR